MVERPVDTGCDEIEPLLTPYVDEEAEETARAAVDGHVEACPACGRRLEAERLGRAVVRARRQSLRPAAPAALRARCTPAAPRPARLARWVPLSLAASLLLAVAGAFVFSVADPIEALAASVAADHMKCFKLQDMSATAEAADVALAWQRDEGWRLPVPPARPDEGVCLVGMRHCISTEGRMAHLLYTVGGQPVSVFVWKEPGDGTHTVEILGQRGVIWSDTEHMFAVVGSVDDAVLARMARYVRQAAE